MSRDISSNENELTTTKNNKIDETKIEYKWSVMKKYIIYDSVALN